jgi:hypothetical protein
MPVLASASAGAARKGSPTRAQYRWGAIRRVSALRQRKGTPKPVSLIIYLGWMIISFEENARLLRCVCEGGELGARGRWFATGSAVQE